MVRTALSSSWLQRWSAAVAVVVALACGGIAAPAAAPELQPLAVQFDPEARAYAANYGYGGVVPAPVAVQVGTAVSKTVHYADQPTVVGYAPYLTYKPDLSAYAAASFPQVEQLRRFNPGFRSVQTVVPKVTAVEPSITVQKTYLDVPVVHHEYRPQVVQIQQQQHVDPSSYYGYQVVDRK